MIKPGIAFFVLALAFGLTACATAPNGDYMVAGHDIGFGSAQVAVAQADVQAAVNALPTLCQSFAAGAAMTNAELALIASQTKLPAKTVANISNASSKGLLLCNGTAAIVAPAATK